MRHLPFQSQITTIPLVDPSIRFPPNVQGCMVMPIVNIKFEKDEIRALILVNHSGTEKRLKEVVYKLNLPIVESP